MLSPHAPISPPPSPASSEPLWPRAFTNLRKEQRFSPLRVTGSVPLELAGTLYWNGAALFDRLGHRSRAWIDTEGAVGAVRIGGGRAEGALAFVRTRSFRAEETAGRRLYSRYDRRSPRPLREHWLGESRNPGNTSVWAHRGRLFALCPAGVPVEIAAEDLSTLGEHDFDGLVGPGFSAHASYSSQRRAFYNFAVRAGRTTTLDLFEFKDDGQARRIAQVPIAGPSFVHDFAVTDRFAIFLVPPLRVQPLGLLFNLKTLGECLRWRGSEPAELVVIPLDAPDQVVRIETDAVLGFHFANAYEQGGKIICDMPLTFDGARAFEWVVRVAGGQVAENPDNRLHRIEIDLDRHCLHAQPLTEIAGESPRISPFVENAPHRYVYMTAFRGQLPSYVNVLCKVDTTREATTIIDFGAERYPAEPVFVPRPTPQSEDDGYLLSLVYDGPSHRSYLAVLDARRPASGPLAELWFDQHVPPPFHGTWVDPRWNGAHVRP